VFVAQLKDGAINMEFFKRFNILISLQKVEFILDGKDPVAHVLVFPDNFFSLLISQLYLKFLRVFE